MLLQFAMSHPHFHGEVQRVMALLRDDDWLGSTTPFGVYYEMIERSAPFHKNHSFP